MTTDAAVDAALAGAAQGPERVGAEGAWQVLRRGIGHAPELRRALPLAVAFAIVAGIGRVVVPVLVQQVLDRWIIGPRRGAPEPGIGLWAPTAVGLGAILVTALAELTTQRRLLTAAEASLCRLRVAAFRHVHALSVADLAEERRGALVARVTSDPETISQFLAWGGISWIVNGTLMVVTATVMAVYDWRLAAVAVITLAPLVFVLRRLQVRLVAAYDTLRARVGDTLAHLAEAVDGTHVIRATGSRVDATRRVEGAVEARRRADVRAWTIGALLFPCSDVFAVLTTTAVLGVGVALGPGQGLSSGTVVAFAFLVGLFLQPVAEFTEILDQTQMAVAGWRRILDLLEMPAAVPDPDPAEAVALGGGPLPVAVRSASYSYPSGGRVLHDLTFELRPGTRAALVGATGSGKSTLAKLLVRFGDPSGGLVEVGGHDLRRVEPGSLRQRVLLVPQEGFLFSTTIGDNVRFARPGATDDDVLGAFVSLGLDDWVAQLPEGLATPVGERGDQLSVGERQLVVLARAALVSPGLLVLDEATSALDPVTEVRVSSALERLAAGRTSITVAHRLSTAARAEVVLVMDGGRLVEVGTHHELVERGGRYAALYERWLSVV